MKPKVWREASLISRLSLLELVHRVEMSSVHSPLGISMAAIAATKDATWDLTSLEGDARVAVMAVFTFCLKTASCCTQKSVYFSS